MIINEIALIINNAIKTLYNNGVHFYQILIGQFIFNLIVYYICNFIKTAQYRK